MATFVFSSEQMFLCTVHALSMCFQPTSRRIPEQRKADLSRWQRHFYGCSTRIAVEWARDRVNTRAVYCTVISWGGVCVRVCVFVCDWWDEYYAVQTEKLQPAWGSCLNLFRTTTRIWKWSICAFWYHKNTEADTLFNCQLREKYAVSLICYLNWMWLNCYKQHKTTLQLCTLLVAVCQQIWPCWFQCLIHHNALCMMPESCLNMSDVWGQRHNL